MKRPAFAIILVFPAVAALVTGCGPAGIMQRADVGPVTMLRSEVVILAADFGRHADLPPTASAKTNQPTTRPKATTQPSKQQSKKTDEKSKSATTRRRSYTRPRTGLRGTDFRNILLSFPRGMQAASAARELAESMVTGATAAGPGGLGSVAGRPGLVSQQTGVTPAVNGRPGLVSGLLTGLRFASPNNVLVSQVNPLSGNGGRCNELANAGLFGSRAACEQHFRR